MPHQLREKGKVKLGNYEFEWDPYWNKPKNTKKHE